MEDSVVGDGKEVLDLRSSFGALGYSKLGPCPNSVRLGENKTCSMGR